MTKLPVVKPKELVKALKRAGFEPIRQKGSHIFMESPDRPDGITVPVHGKAIPKGLLKAILNQADISVDELLELLKK
jgi:predicted RNA binding protein YcfA (HicA-like mRNA interferase family)